VKDPEMKKKLGEEIAAGYHANLELVTKGCDVCKISTNGPFAFAVVVRLTRSGTAAFVAFKESPALTLGRSEVPDAYIVPLRELTDEKLVVVGNTQMNKVPMKFVV